MIDCGSPMYAFLFKFALLTAADPMAKTKTKRIKTAKPQRVINPGQAHRVRLYPRQGLRVVLDDPAKSEYTSEGTKWKFSLYSPYLLLTGKENNRKEQEVYEFSQPYDLTSWAGTSEVYLGEVHYELEGNTHPEANKAPQGGSMMVYSIPENAARPDVLTVINPDEYIVKIEPHRTLEVVVYEDWPKGHLDNWEVTVEDVEIQSQGVFLTETNRTWLTDISQGEISGGQSALPRHTPQVSQNLPEAVRNELTADQMHRSPPTREHHFWFSFSQASQKVAAGLKSGDHVVAKLTFVGKCVGLPAKVVKRQMIVMLSMHGKRVKIAEPEEPEVELTDEERLVRATARVKEKNILTNPARTEQLDFNSSVNNYCIEVVAPNVLWPDEPENAAWEIAHDSTHLKDTYLELKALAPIQKFGYQFQRFGIERKTGADVPATLDQKMLGSFKISYPKKQHTEDGMRRVSVWVVRESETRSAPKANNSSSYRSSIYSQPAHTPSYSSGGSHWKQGQGFYNGRPEKSQVTFEEIPLAPLEANAKTRRLCDVNPHYRQVTYFDAEDAYYGTRTVPTKKKDWETTPTRSLVVSSPQPTIGSTSPGGSSSTPTTTIRETDDAFILYNPVNLQEITLTPKQDVLIRLSQPEDMFIDPVLKEKVQGDLWGCKELQVGEVRPAIEFHRVHKLTSLKYRQEIRIRINSDILPEAAGTYSAGAVQLQSRAGNRIIRFFVKKGKSEERLHTPILPTKMASGIVPHEAAGRKYEYVPVWKHDECVILDPTTMFYVRNPASTTEWPGEWSLRLIQTAIPLELWDKLKNTTDVNRLNPWLKRDQPVHLNGCMFFKPMTMTFNGDLSGFLTQLAKLTGKKAFPVATLLYENYRKAHETTENGSQEVITKVRRRLYIYVALPEVAPEPDLLELPPIKVGSAQTFDVDGDSQINVKVNEDFIVRVRPITKPETEGGYVKHRWQMGEFPGWIDYYGLSQTDYDVFRMKARKPGSGTMSLRTGGRTIQFTVAAT